MKDGHFCCKLTRVDVTKDLSKKCRKKTVSLFPVVFVCHTPLLVCVWGSQHMTAAQVFFFLVSQ